MRQHPAAALRCCALALAGAVFTLTWPSQSALGQDSASVVKVEEVWELVLGEPEPGVESPQISCVTSPLADADTIYAAVDLNHQSLSTFSSGGLQLQIWDQDVPVSRQDTPNYDLLQSPDEVIRWTQSMTVSNGSLVFEVTNGTSTTWGAFGGDGMRAAVATTLENLNSYSPEVSVANSGVGFGGNRVSRLALVEVRKYLVNGQVVTDTTPRVVHELQ